MNVYGVLGVREAAERLSVSEVSVLRWIHAGRLRAYRAGRKWRIDVHDLAAFITPVEQEFEAETVVVEQGAKA